MAAPPTFRFLISCGNYMARQRRPQRVKTLPASAKGQRSPSGGDNSDGFRGHPQSQALAESPRLSPASRVLVILAGCLLAAWIARAFFVYPADTIHLTHEKHTYPPRLVEFRDALAHGCLSPQWCPHFWGGLGSPYFSYYQPTFFYIASLTPWNVPTVRALGVTVFAFALLGYGGMFCFVRRWFGPASGVLSATALLLSVYAGTNVYVRGDFTEFAGMMLVPVALWAIGGFMDHGGRQRAGTIALAGAAIVTTHPCVALMAYPLLVLAAAVWGLAWAGWRRALGTVAALGLGGMLASFYVWPAVLETGLTYSERAFTDFYHYSRNFLTWDRFFAWYDKQDPIPATLGFVLPIMALGNLIGLAILWSRTNARQRSTMLLLAATAILSLFFITAESAWLWKGLPLLDHLQFPWRFLTMATVALAALAGMVLPWKWLQGRWGVMSLTAIALGCLAPRAAPLDPLDPPRKIAETVDDLLENTFVPDAQFEWLPKTAQPLVPESVELANLNPPGCQLVGFLVEQGRISAHVDYPDGGRVILRHFYFAVGWQAAFNGQAISLKPNQVGLMEVEMPPGANGRLEVLFVGTPMRRWGWYVTLVSCLPLALLLVPNGIAGRLRLSGRR
ncbi:MAG: 6-pyruvoyl-tetrahydropterin synthase-related protein [Pirellulales bacterium]